MDQDEQYRRNAAEAKEWAARSRSKITREGWLRVARGWLGMSKRKEPTGPRLVYDADKEK
jgi:hypothetical protein